ncbi:MAG: hypothetical protein Q7S00_00135, partial [bacterium]|nr:hypothetical protein [bacterium]
GHEFFASTLTGTKNSPDLLAQAAEWLAGPEKGQKGIADFNPQASSRYRGDQEQTARLIVGKGIVGHEDADQRPTVMVLGAGEDWSRTMLKDWAGRYKIIIVDLDERKLKQAVDRLPAPLRKYVETDCRDVTGGVAVAFVAGVKRILKESRNPEEAVRAFVNMLEGLPNSYPPAGFFPETSKVDLIISPMLIGYLGALLTDAFFEAFKKRFGDYPSQNAVASKAVRSFQGKVMKAHVRALADSAEKTGVLVHLFDFVTKRTKIGREDRISDLLFDEKGAPLDHLEDFLADLSGVTIVPGVYPWVSEILPGTMELTTETLVFSSTTVSPSIVGGEFDPKNMDRSAISRRMREVNRLLTEEKIEQAARERPKGRDAILIDNPEGRGVLRDFQGKREIMRRYLAETRFSRWHDLFHFIKNDLLPTFGEAKNDMVIGNFGPGFEEIALSSSHRKYFTFEPYLLAALSPSKVYVYDIAPEVIQALNDFDG